MNKVLGLLNFEPSYVDVRGIEDFRPISAASIFGRYRVMDFMMSNFTNSGIDNIKVYIKNRPRSTVEHIQGTSYNINSKKGKIHMLHGEEDFFRNDLFNVDIHTFKTYMEFTDTENPDYVVIAPNHFIFNEDFGELVDYHIRNNNDITMLYDSFDDLDRNFLMCDVLDIKGRLVKSIHKNRATERKGNISLETYVMDINTFKELVDRAISTSSLYSLSDIIADIVKEKRVGVYAHHGFCACISTLKAYYDANMKIREEKNLKELINDNWPIYTKTNDSCPTLYHKGAKVNNSLIANGCKIEGTIINSVIGRNVIIKKGSLIKDSIVLPDSYIGENATIEYAVVDRLTHVEKVKDLKGSPEEPLYIKRGDKI